MDYHFGGSEGVEEIGTWLTMIDHKTGGVWSRVVEAKGLEEDREWLLRDMNEELETWGYAGETVILRSDQEGSIEAVKRGLAEFRLSLIHI